MDNKGSVLMQKYELGRLLGQGTFAKVYYARNIETGQSVAVKVIDKEKILKTGLIDHIKREISGMKLVSHPNIVQLYEVLATKNKIYIVIEYVKGGELYNKVVKGKLKESVARKYFQQLISAVDFCHSRGVYHRDLKLENLLLDEHGNLKVSDFGLSALAESKHQDGLLHTTCGTPTYVAPEVISRRGYNGSTADVWSCGVILFVIMAGYLPFQDSNLVEMYKKIAKGDFKCPKSFPREVRKLLSKIFDTNPVTRISIPKIMENLWFKKSLSLSISFNTELVNKEVSTLGDTDAIFDPSVPGNISNAKLELSKPANLNAFDIISLSAGLDLSGLFDEKHNKTEERFTSQQPSSAIISKLEDIAKHLRLKVQKVGGLLKLEGEKAGRKGVLSIEAEIFEVTPFFHLVEVKKSSGDTLEYRDILKQEIRPALKDIVWTWQGEQQRKQEQEQQELQLS